MSHDRKSSLRSVSADQVVQYLRDMLFARARSVPADTTVVSTALGDGSLCLCQSPNGEDQCVLAFGHAHGHQSLVPVLRWVQLSAADVIEFGGTIGDWVTIDAVGDDPFVITTLWPRRDDDFFQGAPTDRQAEWAHFEVDRN